MLVVLDTNILISALLMPTSHPAKLLNLWRNKRFTLLTAAPQIEELIRVTQYPKINNRLSPALAGRLINNLRGLAKIIDKLPLLDISPDPYDNYLLSICSKGLADYLVTGDKQDLLAFGKHGRTSIVTVTDFLTHTGF